MENLGDSSSLIPKKKEKKKLKREMPETSERLQTKCRLRKPKLESQKNARIMSV